MDVIKVFTEEPVGLESLVPDLDPDARRRRAPEDTLEAFLARPNAPYARVYLAGTALGPPHRVGLTALSDPDAWIVPLLDWSNERGWSGLVAGQSRGFLAEEVAAVLRRPAGVSGGPVTALALGTEPPGALAEAAGAEQRRHRLDALRALLDMGCAVLFPEPAHDGHDWSVFAPAPLAAPLVDAFRQRPGAARCLVAPYRQARGEHKFYLEQWALDDLPDWAEEIERWARPTGPPRVARVGRGIFGRVPWRTLSVLAPPPCPPSKPERSRSGTASRPATGLSRR